MTKFNKNNKEGEHIVEYAGIIGGTSRRGRSVELIRGVRVFSKHLKDIILTI